MKSGVIAAISFVLVSLCNTSCVSVKNDSFHLDAGNVPDNHAVLFIAISTPFPEPSGQFFIMNIGKEKTVYLQPKAINRIYVPAGWQGLVLENVNQDDSSKNTRYEFKKNEVHRFALIEKILIDSIDGQEFEKPYYKLVPTTREAFEQLGSDSNLPLINHF